MKFNNTKYLTGLILSFTVAAFFIARPFMPATNTSVSQNSVDTQAARIIPIDFQFAVNLADDKNLLGASHNVFVGRVVQEIGVVNEPFVPGHTIPVTEFAVDVVHDIKGSLAGRVTVDQDGGYKDGVLYTINSDVVQRGGASNYLLQPGYTYVFATRYEHGKYRLWPFPSALTLVSADAAVSNGYLSAMSESDPRVVQLTAAYPKEVLWDMDVKDRNTLNSFQSIAAETHVSPSVATTSTTSSPSLSN